MVNSLILSDIINNLKTIKKWGCTIKHNNINNIWKNCINMNLICMRININICSNKYMTRINWQIWVEIWVYKDTLYVYYKMFY